MEMSQQGLDLLTQREGKRNDAYLDSVGVATIGGGHTGPEVHLGLHWTDEQVEAALRRDLGWVEGCVAGNVHVPLEQFQHDGLCSLIFNIGAGAFAGSTILRRINAGDMEGAARAFDMWHIPPEIISRRNAEREQFKGTQFVARIP